MENQISHKLKDISYMLAGVDPKNKLQILWYKLTNEIRLLIPFSVRDYYWKHIRTIWNPKHSRIRKAVPRYWMDLDYVIESVNFEIIKSFYEDEYKDGVVDWEQSGKEAKKFTKWLEKAYQYITKERPELEASMSASYPSEKIKNKTYHELYGKVDYYEKLIEETDTKVLTELIKYRKFMWT